MMDCTFPDTGITVYPTGYLTVCCNMNMKYSEGTHLSEVDDLEKYFYSTRMNKWRENFSSGWEKFVGCENCLGPNKVYPASKHYKRSEGLQYLELSTSNVCNQSCVMCSSNYSSKWVKIEQLFDRIPSQPYSFTDADIEKVIKLIPRLNRLMLKGGEPFADQKNLRIVKALSELNPGCKLTIITNAQRVSKNFLDALENIETIDIWVSLDAIGKRYDWIRGGNFKEVEDTIRSLAMTLGMKLKTCPTVSIYNWFHLNELKEYIDNSDYLKHGKEFPSGHTTYPSWTNPAKLLHQEDLDISSIQIQSEYDQSIVDQHVKYTKVMDGVRGFEMDIRGKML